jgi:hypothetical protein
VTRRRQADVERQVQIEEVMHLYRVGYSLRKIAPILSDRYDPSGEVRLSPMWVQRRVQWGMEQTKAAIQESADSYRKIAIAKLDALAETIADRVAHGDLKAVEVALRIEERRARLLGTDAPTKVSAEITDVTPPAAVTELIRTTRERMSAAASN